MEALRKYHLIIDKLTADRLLDDPDFFWKVLEIVDFKVMKNTKN